MPIPPDAIAISGTRGWRRPPGPGSCADLRLTERAIRNGWNVTDEERIKCKAIAMAVLDDPQATTYHKLTAVKVIALVDGIDAKREATAVREANPPTQINVFGDIQAYAEVFKNDTPQVEIPPPTDPLHNGETGNDSPS
jgi:hypothetical protein